MAEPRRISQTVIKSPHAEAAAGKGTQISPARHGSGFRAELPGWDLATLIQMSCARGDRACVEVRCGEAIGHIYMAEGRLFHASVGTVIGEAAIDTMLCWPGGDFSLCERPWPLQASIDASPDAVLIRTAQSHDEGSREAPTTHARISAPGQRRIPSAFAGAALSARAERPSVVAGVSSLARETARFDAAPAAAPAAREGPVLASVRIDMNGETVTRHGPADALGPLVGYVARMGALLGPQLGLAPFEALSADLGEKRALVFVEGSEMVGLLLCPGALHQELRQQLGV